MLSLDQAKGLYRRVFISLIAYSSPNVPVWTLIKETFLKAQLEAQTAASSQNIVLVLNRPWKTPIFWMTF